MKGLQKGIVLLLVVLLAAMSDVEDMAVPISTQYPLFLKILSYDRNLETQAPEEIIIGVVYQDRFRESRSAKDEFLRVAKSPQIQHEINGISVRCVPIEIEGGKDLAQALERQPAHVLYVTPLRAIEVSAISSVSQAQGATTLTGVPEYVEAGLAVGIDLKKDRKPSILVNLEASKAEGANFNAQLLKLVKVISEGGT